MVWPREMQKRTQYSSIRFVRLAIAQRGVLFLTRYVVRMYVSFPKTFAASATSLGSYTYAPHHEDVEKTAHC